MARPKKNRIVHIPPVFAGFRPKSLQFGSYDLVVFSIDEYEAIRLVDYRGLTHLEAAQEMLISRPTLTRLIDKARSKLAEFIVEGRIISIEGGNIHFRNNLIRCLNCGSTFTIDIGDQEESCPQCHSDNLQNLAKEHGHGSCCAELNQEGGENVKK